MESNQDNAAKAAAPRRARPRRHLRHDIARRGAMPRRHHDLRREARSRRSARRDGRRHHRGRFPDRLGRRFQQRAGDRPPRQEFGDLRAGSRAVQGHRPLRGGDQAGAARPHPYLHRHLAAASQISDGHRRERGAGARNGFGHARAKLYRRCRMVGDGRHPHRARLPLPLRRGRHQGGRHHRQHSRHRRLCDAG